MHVSPQYMACVHVQFNKMWRRKRCICLKTSVQWLYTEGTSMCVVPSTYPQPMLFLVKIINSTYSFRGMAVESMWIQIKFFTYPYLQVKLSLCIPNAWLDMSSRTQTQFMCKLSHWNSIHSAQLSTNVQSPKITIDRNIHQIVYHLRLTASTSHISTFKSTQKTNLQDNIGQGNLSWAAFKMVSFCFTGTSAIV